jgi:hypothetical protein
MSIDVYYPAEKNAPVVVIVAGYPDPGFERIVGCKFKDLPSNVAWAKRIGAAGMAAVLYTNVTPLEALESLLAHIQRDANELRVDGQRIALMAISGNVPAALAYGASAQCLVACHGYTMDSDGFDAVAEAARTFRFATAPATARVADLPRHIPLFIARAGADEMPRLNESLDRFIAGALACNLPITVLNEPDAAHASDSPALVQQVLGFLRRHLLHEQ